LQAISFEIIESDTFVGALACGSAAANLSATNREQCETLGFYCPGSPGLDGCFGQTGC